jgi:hypothetical protein
MSVFRYAENPSIGEEQIKQLPKEKLQKDKQQSIKHTHKTVVSSNSSYHLMKQNRLAGSI